MRKVRRLLALRVITGACLEDFRQDGVRRIARGGVRLTGLPDTHLSARFLPTGQTLILHTDSLAHLLPVLGPWPRDRAAATEWAADWAAIAIVLGYAAGSICGNTLVLRWSPQHPLRAGFLAVLGLLPFLYLLAAAAPVPVLVASAVVARLRATVYNVLHQTTLQSRVPEHLVSRIVSVKQLGSLAAVPLRLALAGPLSRATSARLARTVAAGLTATITLAVLPIRDVRTVITPAPETLSRAVAPESP